MARVTLQKPLAGCTTVRISTLVEIERDITGVIHVADDPVDQLIASAEIGDTVAARTLLDWFIDLLEDEHSPPTPTLVLYIAECLERWQAADYGKNESRAAFRLNKPPHRPKDKKLEDRNVAIVEEYLRSCAAGKSRAQSIEAAASMCGSRFDGEFEDRTIIRIVDDKTPMGFARWYEALLRLSKAERDKLPNALKRFDKGRHLKRP